MAERLGQRDARRRRQASHSSQRDASPPRSEFTAPVGFFDFMSRTRDDAAAPATASGDGKSDDEQPVTLEQLRKLAVSMGLGPSAKAATSGKQGKKSKGGKKGRGSSRQGGSNSPAPDTADTTGVSADSPAGSGVAEPSAVDGVGPPLTSGGDGGTRGPPVQFGKTGGARRRSMAQGVSSRSDDVSKQADIELRRASGLPAVLTHGCDCVRRAAAGESFVHENCSMAGIRVPGRRDRTAERPPVLGAEAVAARVADVTVTSEFQMPTPDNIVVLSPDMALQLLIKYTLVLENLEVLLPRHAEVFARRSTLFHVLKAYEDARRDAVHALELDSSLPAAHFRLGMALFQLHRHTAAADAFRAGLEVCPDDKYLTSGWRMALKETTRRRHRLPQSRRIPLPNTPLRTVGKSRDGRRGHSGIHGTGLPILPSRGRSRGSGLGFLATPPATITEQLWRMSDGPPPDGFDRPPTHAGVHPGIGGEDLVVDTGHVRERPGSGAVYQSTTEVGTQQYHSATLGVSAGTAAALGVGSGSPRGMRA